MKQKAPQFRRSVLARSVLLACGASAAVLAVQPVFAQEASLQRVEVTGSSIKKIASEGALPVQTISRADIEKSGVKSAEDLIQALPAMQGFNTSSESVNGGGGGIQNASLHTIGARYTLVLLNGRRLASYNGGSAVNLSSIPLSAVERVEVLTDGASALYGSDAIAGVVNFILRKGQTDFAVDASYNKPQQQGGSSKSFSISKGFGDLENDRFNVMLSYSREDQAALFASDRSFASSGIMPFSQGSQKYSTYQLAVNTNPASVNLNLKNPIGPNGDVDAVIFSPYYMKNGACAPNSALSTTNLDKACWFDYAATVQLIPSSTRDSFYANGSFKLTDSTKLFAEVVSSQFDQRGQFAPPAQVISMSLTDPSYSTYVTPYLSALGIDPANVTKASTNNRFVDAGGRAELYKSKAQHIAFGVEGVLSGFDYTASYVHSTNTRSAMYDGGFMSKVCYNGLKAAGKIDPFAVAGGSAAVFAPCVLHELDTETSTALDTLSIRGSGEIFKAPGGMAMLGTGADHSTQKYDSLPSAITQGPNVQNSSPDTVFGSAPGALPVGATRSNWGVFAELNVPLTKSLEVTAAARYDSYSAAHNKYVFNTDGTLAPETDQGNANSKTTFKGAFRFQASDAILIRGSYGTGFKVANLDEITSPIADFGVTSGKYPCPVKSPDPRAVDCKGTTQYDLLSGGNPLTGELGLKPEESENFLLGGRIEPAKNMTIGLDYWSVKMKNQIVSLPETFPFANPSSYDGLFRTVYDAGQGQNKLSTLLPNFNLGKSQYEGVDLDAAYEFPTALGKVKINWTGTVMLKSEVEIDGVVESSVGRFDAYNNATSKYVSRLAGTVKVGMFDHTLTWNWRSGYHDQVISADDGVIKYVNADGSLGDYASIVRDVDNYSTFDWQTRAAVSKTFTVTVGVKNLFNQDPPLSVRIAGGGNQVGYDGRYANPLGRQLYLSANARF